jgi:integrase/recombinase XerD
MRPTITMKSIKFFIRPGKEEASVYLLVTIKRQKVRFVTGVNVKVEDWDPLSSTVKKSDPFAADKNLVLRRKAARINEIEVKYRLRDEVLTPDSLRTDFLRAEADADFLDFIQAEMGKRRGIVREATHAAHLSLYKKLQDFKRHIAFSDINEDFLLEFQKFMKLRLNNSQNTIQKTMANLKVYVLSAIRKKIITENPFVQVKFRRTNVDRVSLSRDEVNSLVVYFRRDWFEPNLTLVCRMFLFSCFTGLRLSDVKRVSWDDIHNNILVFRPLKLQNVNAITVKIPLPGVAQEILKVSFNPENPRSTVFEAYSDQTTNKYLKKLAEKVGIEKPITFHTARHTFATLYLEANRGDVATLQQLMGHSSIDQTMEYVHITEETKREGIEKLNQLF